MTMTENPLLTPWTTPFGLPPFAAITDADFGPAFDVALTEAAVLVGLVPREHGLAVLLTRRTDALRNHAGQVSFPGGRVDDDDFRLAEQLRAMLAEPAAGDEALQGRGNRHGVSSGSFKGRAYHSARV